ncbi:MAG TPA: long-chain-fatty-acid--CoA ligase [Dehalococcoidales bacterium]|nr:long-chain-fatty-acid--CoA ligase [Dehalococcoidales bacterium]
MPTGKILKELSRYKTGTFAYIIHRHSILRPDKEAYVYGTQRLTYAEFNAKVNSLAHALQELGVNKGDSIGILSWNCLDYAIVYGAAMKGGYILSRFNPRLGAEELDYLINYSEANTLFVGPELVAVTESVRSRLHGVKNFVSLEEKAPNMMFIQDFLSSYPTEEPDVQVEEDDGFFIIYTSGTTGVPRGAVYSHREAWDDCRTYIINLSIQSDDRHIQVSPMFHIAGDTIFRSILYIGGCNIITKFFDAGATLRLIQDEKATHISIVPTHLVAMLAVPDVKKYDVSSLKFIWYGGSPMPLEVLKKGLSTFGNVFGQGYGQSESGPAISHLPKEDHDVLGKPEEKRLSSVGQPDIGVQVRIVDDKGNDVNPGEMGEIIVRSKHIMQKYWNKPEETNNTIVDGWLHTGDIGCYDENGYVYIVDRKKDMIITGGENVFPREIEEILYRHPSVQEAAVIGIPDPYWVEKVHAVVGLKKGAGCTAEELIALCKKNLAGYKAPKSVEFMDSLPKNAAGKIMKRELREKYWADSGRKI